MLGWIPSGAYPRQDNIARERAICDVNVGIIKGQKFDVQVPLPALDTGNELAKVCQRIRQVTFTPKKSRHVCSADGLAVTREQIGNNQKRLLRKRYLVFVAIQKSDFTKSSE
ncbi:hypothetical protein [Rhizobium sp. ERR 1071]|uniref:hypothetical protein n=1 Tax=Rhizobium sp. ERR 1071 TaxID=2572677 RepID=UPI00119D79BC|nr:hypothetical protein [Rhizobium sp. ERR1071]